MADDTAVGVPIGDARCVNEACELFNVRLEADEVAPAPGHQPDRCAACGQTLGVRPQLNP